MGQRPPLPSNTNYMRQYSVQRIGKTYPSPLQVAIKYYTVLSVLNDLGLTEREVQLIAYTAVRGTLSSGGAKDGFIQQFGSSVASVGNMVHKLTKKGIFTKHEGRTVVNPRIWVNFNNNLVLQLKLDIDAAETL